MIRLEHINIVVKDIQNSLTFYQAAFPDWKVRDSGQSEWYGVPRNWLHFGDNSTYITLNDDADSPARERSAHQAGIAHLGFESSNIKALQARLENAGFKHHTHGDDNPFRHNIYYLDPDGLEVEFVQYFSDLTAQRNSTV
ncbi:VOC family protein [Psychromonas ossibalaenae]|uniref:VOC family protein n=1 Tax=Psychromonas ossibalaenae TaxID=444922 RepID=UPI0003736CA0|nr:VOC family protein [Psychromonas ossibalaenae]